MDKKKRKKKRSAASRKRKPKKRARKKSAKAPVYSFKIAAMKLCKRGAQVATSYAAAHWLVDVNPEALALVLYGFAEAGRNALKVKYPDSFGWL